MTSVVSTDAPLCTISDHHETVRDKGGSGTSVISKEAIVTPSGDAIMEGGAAIDKATHVYEEFIAPTSLPINLSYVVAHPFLATIFGPIELWCAHERSPSDLMDNVLVHSSMAAEGFVYFNS